MKLKKAFEKDIQEAFEYWRMKQQVNPETAKKVIGVTVDQWISSLLTSTVYSLIAEKRIATDDAQETKETT